MGFLIIRSTFFYMGHCQIRVHNRIIKGIKRVLSLLFHYYHFPLRRIQMPCMGSLAIIKAMPVVVAYATSSHQG